MTDKALLQQSTLFNISAYAKGKVAAKRKRKGLGELKPRENNPFKQLMVYSVQVCAAKALFAPLDRLRFLSQVRDMPNIRTSGHNYGSSVSTLSKIVSEQGPLALWRGNNANIYRHLTMIFLRVSIYDRVKQVYMPLDPARYQPGFDYYARVMAQSAMLIAVTTAVTYPLDLIHARMATDMTPRGQDRQYATTFDCFNRTNIDEGFRAGLYKGWQISATSAALRSAMTLPVIDYVRSGTSKLDQSNPLARNFIEKIGVSLLSSVTLSLLLYPFDTAKRCMQLNGVRGHSKAYQGSFDVFRKLMKAGGATALYRGCHLYVLREFLTAFAQLSIYDGLQLGSVVIKDKVSKDDDQ